MTNRCVIILFMLCLTVDSIAQISLPELEKKYAAYQSTWGRTKIHLSFHQEKYAPGDTAFFKAYLLNEDLTLVPGKQLMDVALVDSKGNARIQIRSHVTNGIGHNQLIIPDTLEAGVYNITAYNTWMRNFDPAYSFKKKISIVRKQQVAELNDHFIHAAAEGGHLISHVLNRVGVYASRVGATIYIMDEAGKEAGSTVTDSSGTGLISFIPKANTRYTVGVKGEKITQSLPVTEPDGCVMRLRHDINGLVNISIHTPQGSSYREREVFMIVTARGKIYQRESIRLNATDSMMVSLRSAELPTGLVKVSLLDPLGKVIAYRDYYHLTDPGITTKIESDQKDYGTREKIKLSIALVNREGKPVEGEFSLRAINDHLFDSPNDSEWADALSLFPELKIPYTIDRSKEGWQRSVDHFLITASDPLPWQKILLGQVPAPAFPFVNVIEKIGKAYYKDSDQPLPDLTQVLIYLQKNQFGGQTFTVNQGSLSMTIPDFYGDDEFFYMAQVLKGEEVNDIKLVWEDDSFPLQAAPASTEIDAVDPYGLFMERKRLIDQSFGIHGQGGKYVPATQEISNVSDVLEPDVTVQLDDYIVFPTMGELIKEVIPALQYRKTKRGEVVRVDLNMPMLANYNPLYIIDGVATKNTDLFLSLKPAEVKTLKIVNRVDKLLPTGLFGRNGIVLVETRNGSFNVTVADDSKLIKGLNYPLSFNNRLTSENHHQGPDFRSTLYWNPTVKTDREGKATIEFYSSDDLGNIKIELKGLTSGGEPFTASSNLSIRIKK